MADVIMINILAFGVIVLGFGVAHISWSIQKLCKVLLEMNDQIDKLEKTKEDKIDLSNAFYDDD